MTKLAEPIITTLITVLSNNMPAALTKITNEYADGILIPNIVTYHFGERLEVAEFPAMVIDVTDSQIDPDQFSNLWAVYRHTATIDVLVESDTEVNVAHQLHRYARAIWEVLYGNQDLTVNNASQVISIHPRHGQASPLFKANMALRRGWRWTCEIHRYDDLT